MSDDFVWVPAAATDVGKRIREEWERLGQLPPDQDPRVLKNRRKALEYGNARIPSNDAR